MSLPPDSQHNCKNGGIFISMFRTLLPHDAIEGVKEHEWISTYFD